jgi:hypothetical protein
MQTKHMLHKNGGRIIAIHQVGHEVDAGVPWYFYIGDIEWNDGSKSCDKEIAPHQVCFDHDSEEAHAEYDKVAKALNDYLKQHGKWHDRKAARTGYTYSWSPFKKKLAVALA